MEQTQFNELIDALGAAQEALQTNLASDTIRNIIGSKDLTHLQRLMIIYIELKILENVPLAEYMQGHEHFTQSEIRDALGVSNKAIRENLIDLKEKGYLIRGDRPFSWCVPSDRFIHNQWS